MKKILLIILTALAILLPIGAYAGGLLSPGLSSGGAINVVVTNTTSSPSSFKYGYISTNNSTTSLKASAGILHTLVIDAPATSSVITVYDGTVASNTVIAAITLPASTSSLQNVDLLVFDVAFTNGLTIQQTGNTSTLTVSYQ